MKFIRLFIIYGLALSLPLYAQTLSQNKQKITKQQHGKIKQQINKRADFVKKNHSEKRKCPHCHLIVTHEIQKNKTHHPLIKSKKHGKSHIKTKQLHVKKRHLQPPLPIQKTVTLLPAIAPQDNFSIVERPSPSRSKQIITLPPDSIHIEQDKDAPMKSSRPQTMLILKKHMPSAKPKKHISMFSPLKDLFSFDIQPQKFLDTFSFMHLLNSAYSKQIEYLITIVGHQKCHRPTAPNYLLSKSIALFISQQSTVERAINMDGIKEATRVAVLDNTIVFF